MSSSLLAPIYLKDHWRMVEAGRPMPGVRQTAGSGALAAIFL